MAITLADFNKIWASTSPLTPYSFSESNYKQGWNFIGSTPPARQMWDFLQKQNDEKMQYLANNYLPLSGGTITGQVTINRNNGSANNAGVKFVGTNQSEFIIASNTALTKGTAPAGDRFWTLAFYGNDTDSTNKRTGMLEARVNTSNASQVALVAYGCTSNTDQKTCGISVNVDGNGNVFTAAPTPANGDNSSKMATTAFVHNNYLPLSGGTMTGIIRCNGPVLAASGYPNSDGFLAINGGYTDGGGGQILLFGENITDGSKVVLRPRNSNGWKELVAKIDGTLTWDGQPIQTSSDKRLKQDFSSVPDDVLEAWGKVNWQQFKYKEDAERKGDSCRFHTGLVAQDVKEVGEENHVDLLKYGILCHDVREAVEEEKDEDGNIIKEASEAVDLWTIRYEEALAMEVIYLRNEIKKLREEISKLK